MGKQFYSREHYLRLSNGGIDKPGDRESRDLHQARLKQAQDETNAAIGPVTPENVREWDVFHADRLKKLVFSLWSPE